MRVLVYMFLYKVVILYYYKLIKTLKLFAN